VRKTGLVLAGCGASGTVGAGSPAPQPSVTTTKPTAAQISASASAAAAAAALASSSAAVLARSGSASAAAASAAAAASSAAAARAAALADTVEFAVTGTFADVTYGPAGSDLTGSVPMDVRQRIPSDAPIYYAISAQLQGTGSVSCTIKVGGQVISQGTAQGGYNIAQCEIVEDPISGGWQDANSVG
jgi:hypothetical protein